MTHPDNDTLQQLVDGRLNQIEQEKIMAHLADCDACMKKVDVLWAAQPLGTAVSETEALDAATARRMERKVVKRIHRSDLMGEVLRLLVQGFAGVAVALARPLMENKKSDFYQTEERDD